MFSTQELENRFSKVSTHPRSFQLKLLCLRKNHPPNTERQVVCEKPIHSCPPSAELSVEHGLVGDRWQPGDDPGSQITLMDLRVIQTVSPTQDDWHKNGDNLICDIDLGGEHLMYGSKLQIGKDVIVKVNDTHHAGCDRFAARYGKDAVKWVNSKEGKAKRRRGIKATVINGGTVRCGDTIQIL